MIQAQAFARFYKCSFSLLCLFSLHLYHPPPTANQILVTGSCDIKKASGSPSDWNSLETDGKAQHMDTPECKKTE